MRKKKVWRYWCDFCNKGGCGGGAMAKHEKHCTMNPKRDCRMCNIAEENQVSMEELIIALHSGTELNLERLKNASNNCPACILAALRQTNQVHKVEFNYSEEVKAFWGYINERAREAEYHQMCNDTMRALL